MSLDRFNTDDVTRPIRQPRWRYLVCDLLTDNRVSDLALRDVKFDRRISRAGSFQGTLGIANRQQAVVANAIAESVGRLAIWAIRDAQIWWGGIIWTASPGGVGGRGEESMSIQAATFESYAARRIIRHKLTYLNTDQGIIMPSLWRDLQTAANGNIGVIAENQPTGKIRDRQYLLTDAATYEDRIEELGDVIDGSEHTIDVYVDQDGNRVKKFRIGSPQLGTNSTLPPIHVSGHRIPSYSKSVDATSGGTAFQTRGATPGAAQTALAGAISDTDGDINVASYKNFPPVPPFNITIENETLQVTSMYGKNWYVKRGVSETKAAAHDADTPVIEVPGSKKITLGVQTTLTSSATRSDDSITVKSASGFPTAPFYVIIGNETLRVTSTSGTTWTVKRGAASSTVRNHAEGDTVSQRIAKTPSTLPVMSKVYYNSDLLNLGWPELDITRDFTTTSDKDVLNDHAMADRFRFSGQSVVPSYDIYSDTLSDWTPNRIGETVTLKHSKLDLWNPGLEIQIRPVVIEVTPNTPNTREIITFTVDDDNGGEDPHVDDGIETQ